MSQAARVVNLASWSDENCTKLVEHEPEPTDTFVELVAHCRPSNHALRSCGVLPTANRRSGDPTGIKLKVAWTKDQVQQAPDFQYYKPPADTAAGGGQTTGMGQRPSPMAPVSPPAPGSSNMTPAWCRCWSRSRS
jgi:hypothetical protein